MESVAYLGLEAHARHCVLGHMAGDGHYVCESSFETRENALISKHANKNDSIDAYGLCRLLRLGELKRVYHPNDDQRAVFKSVVQQYVDVRDQLTALMNKIKAKYRGWGVVFVEGRAVYCSRTRGAYLAQVSEPSVRLMLEQYYELYDGLEAVKKRCRHHMIKLGRSYPEIAEFERVPGIGPIGAHLFDAYVQTPHRFSTRAKLWRYCRLGVVHRSSNNRPVGRRRLDPSGHSILKDMTYRAWMGSLNRCDDNEVRRFYDSSLARTKNPTHARLNTQRKILTVLWTIWKREIAYKQELFFSDPKDLAEASSQRCLDA